MLRAVYKGLVASILIAIGMFTLPNSAMAHVLIADPGGKVGAILHINPDDDPIAGEPTTMFYDIQGGTFAEHNHLYALVITDAAGEQTIVPTATTANTVTARYTFPMQGTYTVRLSAASVAPATGHAHYFEHTQRVSRGTAFGILNKPQHTWAEAALVACACVFLLLAITVYNRRKQIFAYSKW